MMISLGHSFIKICSLFRVSVFPLRKISILQNILSEKISERFHHLSFCIYFSYNELRRDYPNKQTIVPIDKG